MSIALILWAVWAVSILASPMRSGSVADAASALQRHDDVHWLVVQRPSDDGPSGHFTPGFADPLSQEWQDSRFTTPRVGSSVPAMRRIVVDLPAPLMPRMP